MANFKFFVILVIVSVSESHTESRRSNRRIRQNSNDNTQAGNRVVPIIDDKVFDTRSVDEEALQLLLKDQDENAIPDMSEESSGDFDPTNRWTARRAPQQESDQPISTSRSALLKDRKFGPHNRNFMFENGWIQYKYEKAFILVNQSATREEAEQICRAFNSNEDFGSELAVPQSDEEQAFLNYYMFNMSHCLKNVWIGQKTENYRNSSTEYTLYSNWAKGMPTMTKPCVQIRSPYTIYADSNGSIGGKWEDVACYRKNLVLCQKAQHWSEHQFIRVLTELKLDVEGFKRNQGKDSIPPGFVYIQLPNQSTPKSLWPMYEWKEVTTSYAGLFLRVLGGKAAHFGQIQEATAPRLSGFKSYGVHNVPPEDLKIHSVKADNEWNDEKDTGFPVSFRVSKEEVAPRNTAVKIWKRV